MTNQSILKLAAIALLVLLTGIGLSQQTIPPGSTVPGGTYFAMLVSYVAGVGIEIIEDVIGVDTAVVPTYISGSDSLNFGSIAAGACAELTFALTGASPGDNVAPGWPNTIESDLLGMMYVESANTITVRLCNFTASPIDPESQSYSGLITLSL